jgi:hypothetical protein
MARQLLAVALLTVMMAGCSSTPLDPSTEQGATETEAGSINLPLTATAGELTYRLRVATFTITGSALGGKARVVKPLPDVQIHNEVLPVGTYSILLEKGWILEARKTADVNGAYAAVGAELVTSNPITFTVNGKTPGDAFFGFATTSGEVALGNGSVDIRIGVKDCAAYDTYTASLGALAVDCLGKADPHAFEVTKDGYLTPTFEKCTNGDKKLMSSIRQLLSVQYRSARVPFAKQCMGGRYSAFLQSFDAKGIKSCPTWRKSQVVNPITEGTVVKVEAGLPKLPAEDNGRPLPVLELLKENTLYIVTADQADATCSKSPADCAMACAGGFPGFVISGQGESVLTDPPAWLLDTTFLGATADPFLRPGYYHPMSYYGGVPGVQFGEYSRFDPCGNGTCPAESCSYFAGVHLKTQLQKDCLDDADLDTCVSFCGPPLL